MLVNFIFTPGVELTIFQIPWRLIVCRNFPPLSSQLAPRSGRFRVISFHISFIFLDIFFTILDISFIPLQISHQLMCHFHSIITFPLLVFPSFIFLQHLGLKGAGGGYRFTGGGESQISYLPQGPSLTEVYDWSELSKNHDCVMS